MATSIQVLCPNGRRQTVKVTPSTTLLQALEEVCKKQNFLPAEDYNLVHGRKVVDLTLTFRYANLPNNAKLELVKAAQTRAVSDVVIALQLENGERLQHQFSPNITLWQILEHFEEQKNSCQERRLSYVDTSVQPPLHPVCIYLGEETVGEFALRETTLKALGLTGGRAIVRLIHRAVDDLTIAKSIEEIEKQRAKQARLEAAVAKHQNTNSCEMPIPAINTPEPLSGVASDTNRSVPSGARAEAPASQVQKEARCESFGASRSAEPMEIDVPSVGTSGVRSVQSQPVDKASPSGGGAEAAGAALSSLENIPGVQVFRPSDFQDLTPQEQEIARRLAQRLMPQLGLVPSSSQAQPLPVMQAQPFQAFKFPEETKGKTLYHNELSDVKKEEFQPCERESVLFSADEPRSPRLSDEALPDDFFEVTVADVKILLSSYQKNLEAMDDQPLQTQAMRRNEAIQRLNKYQRVVIRIQFPDKWILQALFRPRETVFAVQKFVKEHLEDKSIPFHLYTSPPKQVLKDITKNLLEAKLVPATVIYFSSEVKKDHYLSKAVLHEASSLAKADAVVAQCLQVGNK
ncbi:tether containing UBX domain for GLUT4-like [Liolophura sinensis]|uniref:tether containing UBX domain for GLUT4-like n=1 Tax=Liolophura sinensis TaxID=3198878 RepID=UPI00315823F5